MIIPEYKTIFVHIPKAAGQSVENFLLKELGKTRGVEASEYLLKYNDNPEKGPERLAHLTALDYIKYNYLSEKEFNQYFKFAVVRNPWARVVSFYKFRGFSSLVSFQDFVVQYLPYYFEKQFWFFRPQADFIYDNSDKLVVDVVGKLENLNEDFIEITQRININFTELPNNNHSLEKGVFSKKSFNLLIKHPSIIWYLNTNSKKNTDYKNIYTQLSRNLVEKLYERDIDLLKYTFN